MPPSEGLRGSQLYPRTVTVPHDRDLQRDGGDEQSGVTGEQAGAALGGVQITAPAPGRFWAQAARRRNCLRNNSGRGHLWRPFVITTRQPGDSYRDGSPGLCAGPLVSEPRAGYGPQPGHVTSTAAQKLSHSLSARCASIR